MRYGQTKRQRQTDIRTGKYRQTETYSLRRVCNDDKKITKKKNVSRWKKSVTN